MEILVIEDDDNTRNLLARFFRSKGFAVRTADNGSDALALLHQPPRPALIVCDIVMPSLNGLAFRRQQLRDPALASIPTIMMSGHARFRRHAARLGIDVFFLKPFKWQTLENALIRYGIKP